MSTDLPNPLNGGNQRQVRYSYTGALERCVSSAQGAVGGQLRRQSRQLSRIPQSNGLEQPPALLRFPSGGFEHLAHLKLAQTGTFEQLQQPTITPSATDTDSWVDNVDVTLHVDQAAYMEDLMDLRNMRYQLKLAHPEDPIEDEEALLPVKIDVVRHAFAYLDAIYNFTKPFLVLGSGDGRVAILAAEHFEICAVGYEPNAALHDDAHDNAEEQKANCKFIKADYTIDTSWAEAGKWGAIFLHALPATLQKLESNLLSLSCPILCVNYALPTAIPSNTGPAWSIYNVKQDDAVSYDLSRSDNNY